MTRAAVKQANQGLQSIFHTFFLGEHALEK